MVELVTGICRVSVTSAVVGMKVTVIVHMAVGARMVQVVVGAKFCVPVVGVAICRGAEPVLVRVMVCGVEVGPGTLLKVRAVGLRERPGSGEPKPVMGAAAALRPVVWRVRRPLRWPVAVGEKVIWRKQEAAGAREPVQAGPPVGALLRAKSPVMVGVVRVTVAVVWLVRVKRVGALVLLTGMGPKSCVMGVRRRPVAGMPVPVRVKGAGLPEELEVRVRVAVCEPRADGMNWTPSQQLMQVPV